MSDLLIRDFPSFAKSRIAAAAKEAGHSISEEAKLRLVQSVVGNESSMRKSKNAYDDIRSAFLEQDAILTEEEHADFTRAVDEMRKDMGRPAPDFE